MGIDVKYWRSSSLKTFGSCQQSYFLSYILGAPEPSRLATEIGTIIHKALEVLAICKKTLQDTGEINVVDEIGEFKCSVEDFLKPYTLTKDEIKANRELRKKTKDPHGKKYFIDVPEIPDELTRYGLDFVKEVVDASCDYYMERVNLPWNDSHRVMVYEQVMIVLDYNDGLFDVRRNNIYATEKSFEVPIPEWDISLKGTIDLMIEVDSTTVEVRDYKSGSRIDFDDPKKSLKDYKKLQNDLQLQFYAYALKKLLPDKDILFTIFFIRQGGPFTLTFSSKHLKDVEKKMKEELDKARSIERPSMQSKAQIGPKCSFCGYKKIPCKADKGDNPRNVCQFINDELNIIGMDEVIRKYTKKNFDSGAYKNPGSIDGQK